MACSMSPTALSASALPLVREAVEDGRVRAATLTVRRGGESSSHAFGGAGSPDAVFLVASINKPMTAAGIMVLADRGELALDDPVCRFIPEFVEGERKRITIRHLLTHTSGLPDMLPENRELRRRHAPLEEYARLTISTPLLFSPGARVRYQSMGFLLMAVVAERIAGRPFAEFLAEEVFTPLGMSRTSLGIGHIPASEVMHCQVEAEEDQFGGEKLPTDWDWNSTYWRNLGAPWGGVFSTGPDIAAFLDFFLNPDGRVVRPETARAMVSVQTAGLNEARGLGFDMRPGAYGRACSERTFGHWGATGTLAWADPASGVMTVILNTLPARVSLKGLLLPISDRISEAAAGEVRP